jgi:hypothetical protein
MTGELVEFQDGEKKDSIGLINQLFLKRRGNF